MKKRISAMCDFMNDAIVPLQLAATKLNSINPPQGKFTTMHTTTIQALLTNIDQIKQQIASILSSRRDLADSAKKTDDEFEKIQKQIDILSKKLNSKKGNEVQAQITQLQTQQQKIGEILNIALQEMEQVESQLDVTVTTFYSLFTLNIPQQIIPQKFGVPQNLVQNNARGVEQQQQPNYPKPPPKQFNPLDDDLLGFQPQRKVEQVPFDVTKFVTTDPSKFQNQPGKPVIPPTQNFASIVPNRPNAVPPPVPIQFKPVNPPTTQKVTAPQDGKPKVTFNKPKIISPTDMAAEEARKYQEDLLKQQQEIERQQQKMDDGISGNYYQEEIEAPRLLVPVEVEPIAQESYPEPVIESAYDPYATVDQQEPLQEQQVQQVYQDVQQTYEQPQQPYEEPQQAYDPYAQQYEQQQQYDQNGYPYQAYDQQNQQYDQNQQQYDQNQNYNQGSYDPYANQW
eukprot:EST48316.1 Hypothetical protein SS50377_11518 [Spironucleus salmonicida]